MMIPYVKLRLTFRAEKEMSFPMFAGSTLRGLFGKSLRRVSCLAGKESCAACAAALTCPYATLFENSAVKQANEDVPNPYVIEPMKLGTKTIEAGKTFSFNHLLFGTAVNKLSYVILAWNKAGRMGFATDRARAVLTRVEQVLPNNATLLLYDFEDEEAETFPPEQTTTDFEPQSVSSVRLELQTPMRLHRQGHPIVPDKLTAYDFIIALLRRQQSMTKHHAPELTFPPFAELKAAAETVSITQNDLHWFDWKRYSSRQQTSIALGGIMGQLTLTGDLTKLYPYLKTGELLHNGKSAVMGMGKYRIVSAV